MAVQKMAAVNSIRSATAPYCEQMHADFFEYFMYICVSEIIDNVLYLIAGIAEMQNIQNKSR